MTKKCDFPFAKREQALLFISNDQSVIFGNYWNKDSGMHPFKKANFPNTHFAFPKAGSRFPNLIDCPMSILKTYFCLLLCSFPLAWAAAQNGLLDSLEQAYRATTEPEQRLELLAQMTDIAYTRDFQLALAYAKRGVVLATESSREDWQPRFHEMQGRMHANLGQLDSASLLFRQAVSGYEALGNKKGLATTYFKMAWVHNARKEGEQGLARNLEALRLMEEIGDQEGIAGALGRIAWALYGQEKPKEALEYAQRATAVCREHGYTQELPYALHVAGYAALGLGSHEEALGYFSEALDLVQSQNMGGAAIADMANARGNAYKKLGRYERALADFQTCLESAEKANYHGGISAALGNLGEVNMRLEDYAAALPYQLRTIEMQEAKGDLANLTENYGHASTIYERLGDYPSALRYERKARLMRDSTASIQSDAAMSQLRTEYETEQKEALIELQAAKIGQQRIVQGLSIGLAALLGLFAFFFYRNAQSRKKANQLLAAQNGKIELLLKEIHHRVKNNLEVVSSLLALQSAQIDDPNIHEAMLAGQNRVQSISIVHQKLYQGENLAAVDMKDYFLNLSENVLDTFDADDRVTIECAMNEMELDIDTAVPLGLIVNELLTNALKYAFPGERQGKVAIQLDRKNDRQLSLRVADDGIGDSGVTKGTGFGAQLLQLLTQQLNGTMRRETSEGTVVYIDFELKQTG